MTPIRFLTNIVLIAIIATAALAQPAVNVIKAPAGCFVPDVIVDSKGTVHMVYALNKNAYYVHSADNGKTFSEPVKVNSEGTVCFTMGERGPKLAVGGDGVIHVVWMDIWAPGVKTFARHACSTDGGKTFQPLKIISSMSGNDGLTIAADDKGNVLAFWHTMNPPTTGLPKAATFLHVVRSTDSGATWGKDEHVKIANLTELACSMCMMRARIAADGSVLLAFRSAENSIRDFYVLKGSVKENKFTAIRVNKDEWNLDSCPMCGPSLELDPAGRAVCAFMTRHKVYWSVADPAVAAFKLHVATPANENDEIYPTAVANKRGDVLMAWQVGPMSISGTATVKWALYKPDGQFAGQQATLGKTTSGTKPTVFVGTDDNFYVVTTAR